MFDLEREDRIAEAAELAVLAEMEASPKQPKSGKERNWMSWDDSQVLPRNLDSIPPGPYLAALLSSVDRTRLSGFELVGLMKARARMRAHYDADVYVDMTEIARSVGPGWERSSDFVDYATDEIATALHLTRRAGETEFSMAVALEGLPKVWEALHAGKIDRRRAGVLVHGTDHLEPDTAAAVIDRIIDTAPKLTTGQLQARLRKLCIEADPADAGVRLEAALEERRLVVSANPDGTANLGLYSVPAERVAAIRRKIYRLARKAKTPDDHRTPDQRRADVLLDLLACHQPPTGVDEGGRAQVDITVELTTLVGLTDSPGHLPGWGPVTAEIARRVVDEQHDARWVYTVTEGGDPLATGTLKRRPAASQAHQVRALSPTCVFPGCRMPSYQCDLDHIRDRAKGGRTCVLNLAPLCRHHHMLKHHSPWHYRRLRPGVHQWTSRLGHTYTTARGPP